ncbi:MAG: hypothetical protein M3340_13115 [Actinomycetota bacterium]|nr:hypothetical protein [Actinomycetota bacterium]
MQPAEAALARRAAGTAATGIIVLEIFGAFLMWLPNPLAWIWLGARAFELTDRAIVGGSVAMLGIIGSTVLLLMALSRLDLRWIALRQRAGHDQKDGVLVRVVVVSATMAIIAFYIWNLVNKAFIMPFMPMN